ncbi:MAG TPA: threonine synthase [Solirubrobacterales bacterium]|nr:threonine synthase [Solirubrobacterales bacterium]
MASSSALRAFTCSLCNAVYRELPFAAVCERCSKPLNALYEYESVRVALRERPLAERPRNLWRLAELLPVEPGDRIGVDTGFSPLIRAERLGRRLGLDDLWIKNDTVLFPTLSYKDRVVSVAMQRALESGERRIGCVSTGNVGSSVAAIASRVGIDATIFYPRQVDQAKITSTGAYGQRIIRLDGTYDEVNAVCRRLALETGVPFVNINLRPYYAEGAKTLAYEIAEQLDWRPPDHCIVPVAGTTLIRKVVKGFWELDQVRLTEGNPTRVHAAQAAGCAPVARAILAGADEIEPCVPETFADSIAIGAPSEGGIAAHEIRSVGGSAAAVTDEEILRAMALLAETEGILVEPAGGTSIAAVAALRENGTIARGDRVVAAVTGNALKTLDAVAAMPESREVAAVPLAEADEIFERWLGDRAVSGERSG